MKKVALITGASSGIGLDTGLRLIDEGYKVYGAARRTDAMAELVKKGGTALYLNLCDERSIEECVKQVLEAEGQIDLLVNNAGFGLGGSIEEIPLEEAKKQFDVNVFGMAKLIQLVLPSMRNQKSGKIINISSMAGRFSSAFTGWYHATKYSVEALSDALRLETSPFGIKVVIVEPGLIQTNWGVIHGGNIRKYSGSGAYSKNAGNAARFYEKGYVERNDLTKPEVISKLIVKIAKAKNPKPRYAKGKFTLLYIFFKKHLTDRMFDRVSRIAMGLKK